jgi:hypothetical protein
MRKVASRLTTVATKRRSVSPRCAPRSSLDAPRYGAIKVSSRRHGCYAEPAQISGVSHRDGSWSSPCNDGDVAHRISNRCDATNARNLSASFCIDISGCGSVRPIASTHIGIVSTACGIQVHIHPCMGTPRPHRATEGLSEHVSPVIQRAPARPFCRDTSIECRSTGCCQDKGRVGISTAMPPVRSRHGFLFSGHLSIIARHILGVQ